MIGWYLLESNLQHGIHMWAGIAPEPPPRLARMKPPRALSSLNTTQLSNSGIAYLNTALIVVLQAITRSYMNSRLVCRALTFSSSRIPPNPARVSQHIKTISRPFTQIPTVKMANRVHRITMFKLPSKDEQAKLLDQYHKLNASQQKVSRLQSISICTYLIICSRTANPISSPWLLAPPMRMLGLRDIPLSPRPSSLAWRT